MGGYMALKTILPVSLILIILWIGCTQQTINLDNTSWKLDSYRSSIDHIVSPISTTKLTLEFKDGKISGSAGCNSYFAKYTQEGSSLNFGLIGSTKMYCTNPSVMDQETTYFSSLKATNKFKIDGNKLILMDADGKVLLTFSKD